MERPIMTRRQYELIARVLRSRAESCETNAYAPRSSKAKAKAWRECCEALALDFAAALRSTNERFEFDRFVDACKPGTEYRDRSR